MVSKPGDPGDVAVVSDLETPRALVERFLAGGEVSRLPVMPITMMFAGDRAGIRYGEYCRDFRALVRAQQLVAERFGFDHVSCISDPSREAADLGATIQWYEDQPPAIDETDALLHQPSRLATLRPADPLAGGRMTDRVRAAEALRAGPGARHIVEGWVEGPCAEAADLRGINALMLDFYDDAAFVTDLFAFATELGIAFAKAQVDAGVDVVGVGDAAASLVGPAIYEEVVWPFEHRLIEAIHAMGVRVRLHICGNMSRSLEPLGRVGADILDLDYPVTMRDARASCGPDQILAGNINPVTGLMQGSPASIETGLAACHAAAGRHYVVAAGCEVPRTTPDANVRAMVSFAHHTAP